VETEQQEVLEQLWASIRKHRFRKKFRRSTSYLHLIKNSKRAAKLIYSLCKIFVKSANPRPIFLVAQVFAEKYKDLDPLKASLELNKVYKNSVDEVFLA
jgi:hypothetical protein